jgi:hypothetical protein
VVFSEVKVEIPSRFVSQLAPEGGNASRTLLEEAVAGAYRERRLTMAQVRQLLGYGTRMQVDAFLQQHEIYDYTVEDFEKDMATFERLFPSRPEHRQSFARTKGPLDPSRGETPGECASGQRAEGPL